MAAPIPTPSPTTHHLHQQKQNHSHQQYFHYQKKKLNKKLNKYFYSLLLCKKLDDVLPDDETHWQHRVSSGFDRLVAFASTELDKTRRSIDTDIVPSSISCNTSPDSGITHSSSNSEAARTFLSTSSTSSQLDLPISSGSSTSSSGNGSSNTFLSSQQAQNIMGAGSHLTTAAMHDHLSNGSGMPLGLKACPSPTDRSGMDSPPLSDMGLPRTPSPNVGAAVTPPPPSIDLLQNSFEASAAAQQNSTANCRIPLKYQRKSKLSSEKHYKKKFCERNWEYDGDDLLSFSNSSSAAEATTTMRESAAVGSSSSNGPTAAMHCSSIERDQIDGARTPSNSHHSSKDALMNNNNTESLTQYRHHNNNSNSSSSSMPGSSSNHNHHHHHKSSKFRPKGKDWDWSLDSNSSSSHKSKHDFGRAASNSSV